MKPVSTLRACTGEATCQGIDEHHERSTHQNGQRHELGRVTTDQQAAQVRNDQAKSKKSGRQYTLVAVTRAASRMVIIAGAGQVNAEGARFIVTEREDIDAPTHRQSSRMQGTATSANCVSASARTTCGNPSARTRSVPAGVSGFAMNFNAPSAAVPKPPTITPESTSMSVD